MQPADHGPRMTLTLAAAAFALLAGPEAIAGPRCVAPPFRPTEEVTLRGHAPVRNPFPAEPFGPAARSVPATTGSLHVLVILAEFADLPPRIAPARFDDLLFGPGPSIRDYFDEVSGRRLDLSGDLVGWVTLPGDQLDYSDGVGGVGDYPRNGQRMAEDAVRAAVDGGIDLSDFDADDDGVVDALLVVHSGQGFEWAGATGPGALSTEPDANSINSHKWTLVEQEFGGATKVVDYFTCPELQLVKPRFGLTWADSIATIGVYCHEFGHVLGLPDFYDVQTFENHVGVWEIMDYGTWNQLRTDPAYDAPGAIPSHFSAWSKMFLGWTSPTSVAPPTGESIESSVSLFSASTGSAPLQLLGNPFGVDWAPGSPGTGEFFLAEVRTREGYDAGLPSEGLLLYHIDEGRSSNSALTNADDGRILRLMPQDGQTTFDPGQSVGDPWPGSQTAFGPASSPSSDLYDNGPSGVAITGIQVLAGSAVSFAASVTNLRAELGIPFARPNPWSPAREAQTQIVITLDPSPPADATVSIWNVRGRHVRTLDTPDEFSTPERVARWDGRDERGNPVPAGVYVFRTRSASGSGAGKVLLLR